MLDFCLYAYDEEVFVALKFPYYILDLRLSGNLLMGILGCHVEEIQSIRLWLVLLPLIKISVCYLFLELVLL